MDIGYKPKDTVLDSGTYPQEQGDNYRLHLDQTLKQTSLVFSIYQSISSKSSHLMS